MKKKLTHLGYLLLAVVLMHACAAPKSVIRLEPEREDVKWLFGQSYVTDSLYGVVFEVAFDRAVQNQYWFDFNIINHSNMPILIDPVNFTYMAYDSLNNRKLVQPLAAIDPEEQLMSIDKELSRNDARAQNHLGISLVAASVDIATGVATLSDDNPNNDYLRTNMYEEVQNEAIDNEIETQNLNSMREEWSQGTIRKTTLGSNYSMQGKVFFKSFPTADYIKLFIPVDDSRLEIIFNQRHHRP